MFNRMYVSKRDLLAQMCFGTGLLWLLEHAKKRRALIVLNYHRVGNCSETPFDRRTFSASAEAFEEQVSYLKRHFHICTIDEAVSMVKGDLPFRSSLLITFDDGYVDQYKVAFPILHSHGVQATFFLPTGFVGTDGISWWDSIAYSISHSRKTLIRLTYPKAMDVDVSRDGLERAILRVLHLYRELARTDCERFLEDLQEACQVTTEPSSAPLFINWHEVREMYRGGMAFGSHSHTHEILSRLDADGQAYELSRSRLILERELGARVNVLAYPIGLPSSFNQYTLEALRNNAYDVAFSFYGGFNLPASTQRFDIRRVAVDNPVSVRFRLQMCLAAITARTWF